MAQNLEKELQQESAAESREAEKKDEALWRLSAIVESSDDAIISKTPKGIITSWNAGAKRMFGYTADEAIGKPITILFPRARIQEEEEIQARLHAGERIQHYETERIAKDGKLLDVSITVSPIKDSMGNIVGASKIARDITDSKRAEQVLKDEARILDLLNKTGTQIASMLDLETLVQTVTDAGRELSGAKFGAFFYNVTNNAGEGFELYTISGAPREAFEGFGVPRSTALFSPTIHGEHIVRSGNIVKDHRYGSMPPHHGMPKGHLPVCSYLAVPVIAHSGEVFGGLLFGHPEPDIFTERSERLVVGIAAQAAIAFNNARIYEQAQKEIEERKRTEAALQEAKTKLSQHAENLEKLVSERTAHLHESIRSLESVCYTIAHDLRAPLRAVQGFTQIIVEDYASAFDDEGKHLADRIMTAATRMDALIRDLLEYAKLGHVELPCQNVDLNVIVQKSLESLNSEIEAKNAQITVKPLPDIWGNPTIGEQIFTNLLSNALKFVSRDVKPSIEIWSEPSKNGPRVCIRDNGIGIDPAHHARVFEMFQRLHDDEKKFSGTGVGLAIVAKGMERLGGKAYVDQNVTEGTCFCLDFQLPKSA